MPKEIEEVLEKILNNGFEAFIVGGFVRDYLLNKKTNDIDIATNALPKDLVTIFGPSRKNDIYGSYHLSISSYNIDITTYRKEEYKDNELYITYSDNLINDSLRRDFTINALYMNKDGSIIDLYDGKKDLENHILKMIGNPRVRLKEDPIRILRAVRFVATYNLKLDKNLKHSIEKEKHNLSNISIYKIRKELDMILLANGFPILKSLGLLKVLGILNDKIIYINDISGLWSQIKTTKDYIYEKELKNHQKNINTLLKCDTISMHDLYKYGYYICMVTCKLKNIKLAYLDNLYKKMPIHKRSDIIITPQEIIDTFNIKGKDLGILLNDLEIAILDNKIDNNKEDIIKYIEERR